MKLYEQNSYIKTFKTTIKDVVTEKEKVALILKDTAFYPESGGQPYDLGQINSSEITAVYQREDEVLHYIDRGNFKVGDEVECFIDWERRYTHMQLHTAEHILSGILKKYHKLDNVGFHIGDVTMTIDINGTLDEQQLLQVEQRANNAVWENREIFVVYPQKPELSSLDYRSKKEIEGEVRIVDVSGVDLCACCGTHTARTGEVGMIKILSAVTHKGGLRLTVLSGKRLYERVGTIFSEANVVGALLSVKTNEISGATAKLKEENMNLKTANTTLQDTIISLTAEKILSSYAEGDISHYEQDLTVQAAAKLATTVLKDVNATALIYSDNTYAVATNKNINLKELSKQLSTELSAKGGGSPTLIQGMFSDDKNKLPTLFQKFVDKITD